MAKQIFPVGLYQNIPNETYHESEGISSSGLRMCDENPALYKYRYIDGNKNEPTDAMELGTRIHEAILQPELFAKKYTMIPEKLGKLNKNSNLYKEGMAEFLANHQGVEIMPMAEHHQIQSIAEKVFAHPVMSKLLQGGHAEVSGYWIDDDTGVLCKCRPDYFRNDGVMPDIKTTIDCGFKEFERSIASYQYHIQAAFYIDGMAKLLGKSQESMNFVFLALEKKAPYWMASYELNFAAVERGRDIYKNMLVKYAKCLHDNNWPDVGNEIQSIALPPWGWTYQ